MTEIQRLKKQVRKEKAKLVILLRADGKLFCVGVGDGNEMPLLEQLLFEWGFCEGVNPWWQREIKT